MDFSRGFCETRCEKSFFIAKSQLRGNKGFKKFETFQKRSIFTIFRNQFWGDELIGFGKRFRSGFELTERKKNLDLFLGQGKSTKKAAKRYKK